MPALRARKDADSGTYSVAPAIQDEPVERLQKPPAGVYHVNVVQTTAQGGMTQGEYSFDQDNVTDGLTRMLGDILMQGPVQDARILIKRMGA